MEGNHTVGRHRKPPVPKVRRGSVIALTSLVPAGLATVTGAADGSIAETLAGPLQHRTLTADADADVPRLEAAPAAEPLLKEAKQLLPPPPPEVKTVALPDGRVPADLPKGTLGMPGISEVAYHNAERILAAENPVCGMPWSLLAGIGRVESTHAFGGKADADGNALDPIYGPVLDGSLYGNNVIHDSDDGVLDGLQGYDRAIGSMQFLPETWKHYAADGNGDGIADPQNLYDAALTAGKYLCSGNLDMRDPAQQTRAILRYNHSMAYVTNVMAWEAAYNTGITPAASQLPRI
ncbi:lytic murein transglycosylase [Nocardia huaxiensis]|nr:lytic murein transglycosylase [Nocardia huaxiensis]UFS93445.1 lytic murein transglycosylase [Nocardia huaxiensis]